MTKETPLVSIRCLVYNHEKYLRQCLDGFVMQKTNFKFEAIVHDDASTDNSATIIKEYADKYPNIIKPIIEKENLYTKNIVLFRKIIDDTCTGKYIALCEGDDYWIDPLKLQKQVDFLESHPDYTMCCSDAVIQTPQNQLNWTRFTKDIDIPIKDIILKGGQFIQTATIMYKRSLLADYPSCCKECHVGDYPLQIWSILNGKVRYFSTKTAVYRFMHNGSWTEKNNKEHLEKKIKNWKSEFAMLQGLNVFSNFKYNDLFKERQAHYLHDILISNRNNWIYIVKQFRIYNSSFKKYYFFENFLMHLHLQQTAEAFLYFQCKEYRNAFFSFSFTKKLYNFINRIRKSL